MGGASRALDILLLVSLFSLSLLLGFALLLLSLSSRCSSLALVGSFVVAGAAVAGAAGAVSGTAVVAAAAEVVVVAAVAAAAVVAVAVAVTAAGGGLLTGAAGFVSPEASAVATSSALTGLVSSGFMVSLCCCYE